MKAMICGAGGFIGSYLAKRLKAEGYTVHGIDIKMPEFSKSPCDFFHIKGLTKYQPSIDYDELYQLAGDMGGAGYAFTGVNDANIMRNSAQINLNVAEACRTGRVGKVFFSSSACVYSGSTQEDQAYPANPASEYGWEKLFSERLWQTYAKTYGFKAKIARFQTVYGEESCFEGGREKSIAALCRKVALMPEGGEIEVWGDGTAMRSFMHIDQCIDGIRKLMKSDFDGPVNLGTTKEYKISDIAAMLLAYSGKNGTIKYVDGPVGPLRRATDNTLIRIKLGWEPLDTIPQKLKENYNWIVKQMGVDNAA